MPLSYAPALAGQAIDSAIKGATRALTGDAASQAGVAVWTQALTKLYAEFDTTLASSVMTYLATAQVMFPPGIPVPLVPSMPAFALTPLAAGSASAVDSNIKSKTSQLRGQAAADAGGVVVWTELCKQVGLDVFNSVPVAVCNACKGGVALVPSGFAAPPMTASIAPAPPIEIGLQEALLKGMMAGFFTQGIGGLGAMIDQSVKAQCRSLRGDAAANAGATVWQAMMDVLAPNVSQQLGSAIQMFLTASIGAWTTTPVPGNPLIAGVPTPGVTPAPACIIIT